MSGAKILGAVTLLTCAGFLDACSSECGKDFTCKSSEICRNGTCRPRAAQPPGGAMHDDASLALDLGLSTDGPSPDANSSDAGMPDEGLPPVDGGSLVPTYSSIGFLRDIQGTVTSSGPVNNLWVVGDNDVMLRFDGTQWSPVLHPRSASFAAVWSSGPGDVWFAEDTPNLQHYDGTTFSSTTAPQPINAIYGFAPDNVFFVGAEGLIIHFDGHHFQTVVPADPSLLELAGVWGPDPSEIWASGSASHVSSVGLLLHSTNGGASFAPVTLPSGTPGFDRIWGSGPSDIWIAGVQALFHTTGGATPTLTRLPIPTRLNVRMHAVWGTGPHDIWTVGSFTVARCDGTNVTLVPTSTTLANIYGVWGEGPGGRTWVLGNAVGPTSFDIYEFR